MPESDIKDIHFKIKNNNYLTNCYKNLTKSKVIHFIINIAETVLNLLNILDTVLNDYCRDKNNIEFIAPLPLLFHKLTNEIKLLVIIFGVLIFDTMHIILTLKEFQQKRIYIKIIINFLELFFFRFLQILFLYMYFSLNDKYFLIGLIFILIHIYLIVNNFLYCHLYYFVPVFIEHPYDEFSSFYDIVLFIHKIISAISYYITDENLGKFYFMILLLSRIYFSISFFEKSRNHSYLYMKNTFLNKTKQTLFWTETVIMIISLLVGKKELKSIFFGFICVGIFVVIFIYMHFLYNPFNYIHIESETPNENIYFYFYILSNENFLDFLLEDKIREHYDKCGYCKICKKFFQYMNKNKKLEGQDELIYLNKDDNLYEDNSEFEVLNKNQYFDLFDILFDGNHNYFKLMKEISENYKCNQDRFLNTNIEYYFINLSYLIYSDYENYNFNLSMNEKIILKEISQHLEILEHQTKITQLLLCNEFIETSKKIITKIKDILSSEQNITRAKKLIDLSFIITELQKNKYRYNLFNKKLENVTNSKNLIIVCSIIYEEIFNTALGNLQIPIRNNVQILEDAFNNNLNKKISLSLSFNKKECKIIRAGKGLSAHLNENLFNLFPIEFKQYQIDQFIKSVLNNFNYNMLLIEKQKEKGKVKELGLTSFTNIREKTTVINRVPSSSNKQLLNAHKIKNKREYIKIEVIVCQNISSKIYYQLVTLKLTPLFHSDNNYFILLDGVNYIHQHAIITMIDHEQNKRTEEYIFSISEPKLELETEILPISLKKYTKWLTNQGFTVSKVFSFNIYSKMYYIYMVLPKDKDIKKKTEKNMSLIEETKLLEEEDYEHEKSQVKTSVLGKMNFFEDNASVFSQQFLNSIDKGIFLGGFKNKKKESTYKYAEFTKIRRTAYIIVILNIIIIIAEYFYLNSIKKETESNNNTFLKFREFYKSYFQLFSMTLSIACIDEDSSKCNSAVSFYADKYFEKHPEDKFDIISFLNLNNYLLSVDLINKRTIFNNVYKYIGAKRYNEFFRKYLTYLRINKTFVNNELEYSIITIEERFFELILTMCNNFKFITTKNTTNSIIYFLNGVEDVFSNWKTGKNSTDINLYQQYLYELIFNHKMFSLELDRINQNLISMLDDRGMYFTVNIYIYINLNIVIIIIIVIIIYLYIGYFEKILIRILNIINMNLNKKTEEFDYNETLSVKMNNLDSIITLYNESPRQYLRHLSDIYNKYQQFIVNQKKQEAKELENKGYKLKYEQKKDSMKLDEIPKRYKIINRGNVRNLKILHTYFIIFIALVIIAIWIYVYILLYWQNFFEKEKNLYILLNKDTDVETAIYRAINLYYMMVFNNLTIDNATSMLYPHIYNSSESLSFFKYIYSSLKLELNSKIEVESLGNLFKNFEGAKLFSCSNIYEDDAKEVINLYNSEISPDENIKEKLANMCLNFLGIDSETIIYIIENHFQYIKNGIINLNDFSYKGIIEHLKDGYLGRISLFFNSIMTFVINVFYLKRHQIAIGRLIKLLDKSLQISRLVFIFYDVVLTVIILFFFIRKIKNYCNQMILLKKVFQISKVEL